MFEIFPFTITIFKSENKRQEKKREKKSPYLQSIGKTRDISAISDLQR